MSFNTEALEYKKILQQVGKNAGTTYAQSTIMQLNPLNSFEDVKILLAETKEAFDALVKYGELPLGGLSDVKNAILRSQIGGMLEAFELLDIAQMVSTTANVLKYQKNLITQKMIIPNLTPYFEKLVVHNQLKSAISLAIEETGRVSDNASQALFMTRRSITSAENRLRNKMNELLVSKASMLNEALIVIRNNRMCLPVKAEQKNNFKGIIHDESASHTTAYIEPLACVEINTQIQNLRNQEKKEIEEVLHGLSLLAGSFSAELLQNLENLTVLDVIFAKAKYALANDDTLPQLNYEGIVDLKRAKHPLIEKEKVVPIDLQIGRDFQTIIITGPNTGGKTVALKTIGLLTCMAQTGLFVPVKEGSMLAVFDNVFVDIGDEQSIEQSLSTFSSHMTKVISIIDNLTINSLVLLDELGSGTDPKEGSSLAISIIDYLKERGARTIVTTHYTDLKAYAFNNNDVCNASVEFNIETLEPTYKLLMGVPGKSNAIEIAKRLGLNNKVIENARNSIETTNTDVQALLDKLDEETQKMSNTKDELEHTISEYNIKLASLEQAKKELESKNDQIIKQAKKEADKIIVAAKANVDALLAEIDDLRKKADYKEHELADIKYLARNLAPSTTNEPLFEHQYRVGEHVYIKSYDKNGVVTKIKKEKIEVKIGNFKMDFLPSELSLTNIVNTIKLPKKRYSGSNPVSEVTFRLDLRGYRYEEVKPAIESFIDKAYLGNAGIIQIVHGFGTGAVRNAVLEYLKTSPYVKSYRYGGEGEGLNGVTVVYLK